VTAVAYSPDGTHMASGSDDATLKVWDAASGAELATLSGHTDRVVAVAYSPDGTRIVSGSFDQTSKLWDTQTMECVGMLSYSGWVSGCDFSPLGTHVCCGGDGGGVYILELMGSAVDHRPERRPLEPSANPAMGGEG
jgi:WD40 repeat protein